jgi:TrmH family RNA methyltransferase
MCPAPTRSFRIVQSPANRWVKALRAAVVHPPGLRRAQEAADAAVEEPQWIATDGFHLLVEALRSGIAPAAIFFRSGEEHAALHSLQLSVERTSRDDAATAALHATELIALPPALFQSLLDTESPQPIAALLPAPSATTEELMLPHGRTPLLLVLAGLQDPGNVGTLLRSAEAFGATGALLLGGTATPWSSKCLRASAGSALRLPLLAMRHAGEAGAILRLHGIASYATVVAGGVPVEQVPLHQAAALWIGNEGAGLGEKELAFCESCVTLPMPGGTESLNAAVAGSLLLYEAARQRTQVRSDSAAQASKRP